MGKEKKKSLMSYNKFDILSNDALDQRVMQAREVNFTRYKMMIMTLKFKLKKKMSKESIFIQPRDNIRSKVKRMR